MTSPFVPIPDMPDPVRRCWPSPSERAAPWEWERLLSEVQVRWLDPTAHRLPWLREKFIEGHRPRGREVRAVTLDKAGRTVRAFIARDDDLAAYGQLLEQRRGTCPWEAVDPATIAPGRPAEPAHPKLFASIGGQWAPSQPKEGQR